MIWILVGIVIVGLCFALFWEKDDGQSHHAYRNESEDNGENFVMVISTISLIISIIGAIVLCYIVIDEGSGLFAFSRGAYFGLILTSVAFIVIAVFVFCVIKVFVNISRKATAIYKLLDDRLEERE